MDHMNLSDKLRNQLLESAAWGKAGITPRIDEEKAEAVEVEEVEETEEVVEEAVHVCPLCTSQLEEAIEEDRLLEHLNVIVGLVDRLSQMNEGSDATDIATVIDETIQELLFQDLDEE